MTRRTTMTTTPPLPSRAPKCPLTFLPNSRLLISCFPRLRSISVEKNVVGGSSTCNKKPLLEERSFCDSCIFVFPPLPINLISSHSLVNVAVPLDPNLFLPSVYQYPRIWLLMTIVVCVA